MKKKELFNLGLLFLALFLIGGGTYYFYTQREEDVLEETPEDSSVMEEEKSYNNLNLEYDYVGENTWQYTVTGTLPNPCYEIETEAIVAESLPEQVTIRSIVTPPDEDEICTQVVQEVYEEGEFQASEEAVVIFEM